MRVLLVEDDPEVASVIADGLSEWGMSVAREATFAGGRSRAMMSTFDVIVLDVMLPGGDGFELCRGLRQRGVASPVLMLTARDAVDDRVRGLEAGADDYLTKPFAFRELVARVRALARRPPTTLAETIVIADLSVDIPGHRVRRGPRDIELTAKEFALLECLVRHRGRVVDRATITAHVWDDNHDPFTNVLEVLVRRLRRKIDDGFELKLIHTLRGSGYRLGA
ncbi:MAG TPA: response regulator transcription factor [Gemmatimonadaceae bacterium]|jgi:two-component system copper resistance phosphate regulon response regulator CusR|nr:response regulator transcription factor [Gemmatimonadaceae bacterium]